MNFIRDTKIRTIMVLILILFSLLWGGVSAFALYSLSQLKGEIDLTNVQQINGDIINGASGQYYRAKSALDRAAEAKEKGNTSELDVELRTAAEEIARLKQGLETFKVTDHANIDTATVDEIYNSSFRLYSQAMVPMLDAIKADRMDTFQQLSGGAYRDLRRDFTTAIDKYNGVIANLKEGAQKRIDSWVEWCKQILIAALVMGALIVVLADRYLAVFLVRPLERIQQHLQILAEGILHTPIEQFGKNCVGKLVPFVQRMQGNWVKTVSDIRGSAEEIYRSAGEIAAGNTDLSSRTEEQASALEQTAASMEQLSAVVKQNADNANQASVLAKTASQTANEGGDIVNGVIQTMSTISGSSQKIADIISVINGIAFQTNILALNAAVEAARAGEQGRGFAVVAGEVRSLAQRSAQAAKEIESLIDESVNNVKIGSDQVALAGSAMENIVKAVTSVTDIMGEIASASTEQSKGISQVGQAVVEMDSVTQQNAALVEQSATASASLEEQARHLNSVVSIFQLSATAESSRAITAQKTARPVAAIASQKALAQVSAPKAGSKSSESEGSWETF